MQLNLGDGSLGLGMKRPSLGASDLNFANVTLLLHGDGLNNSTTFTDSSSHNRVASVRGGAKISTAQSKWGGSSMYFDGVYSGQPSSLVYTPNSPSNFGMLDFTVEMWVYPIARLSNAPTLIHTYTVSTNETFGIFAGANFAPADTTKYQVTLANVAWPAIQSTSSIVYGAWAHIAVVRNSGSVKLYLNGVQEGATVAVAGNLNGYLDLTWIGAAADNASGSMFNGYIDDLRITNGTGRAIVVPSGAYPNS